MHEYCSRVWTFRRVLAIAFLFTTAEILAVFAAFIPYSVYLTAVIILIEIFATLILGLLSYSWLAYFFKNKNTAEKLLKPKEFVGTIYLLGFLLAIISLWGLNFACGLKQWTETKEDYLIGSALIYIFVTLLGTITVVNVMRREMILAQVCKIILFILLNVIL
jgi:hypothetical protein